MSAPHDVLDRLKADDEDIREAWIGEPYLNADPPANWSEQLWAYRPEPEPIPELAPTTLKATIAHGNEGFVAVALAAGFEQVGVDANGTRTFQKRQLVSMRVHVAEDAPPDKPFWNPPPATTAPTFADHVERVYQETPEDVSVGVQYVQARRGRRASRMPTLYGWSGFYG